MLITVTVEVRKDHTGSFQQETAQFPVHATIDPLLCSEVTGQQAAACITRLLLRLTYESGQDVQPHTQQYR